MRLIPRTRDQIDSPIGATDHLVARAPKDRPLLDVSQGAPSYPTAPVIAARMAEVAREATGNRYTPGFGLTELRQLLAEDVGRAYQGDVRLEQVLITAGCNQAFCVVTSSLAAFGDEVLLPTPYYFNHDMWLRLDQVRPVYYGSDQLGIPSPQEAARKITDRTRAIVLVTPGNPTGVTVPPAVIEEFYELAHGSDIALVLDETYRSFRGTPAPAHQLFGKSGWPEHLVSLHSFSKDFAMPGARVGAVIAGRALVTEAMKLMDCMAICAPRIGQEGAIAGLKDALQWRADRAADVRSAQVRFEEMMSTRPGGFELRSAGAFYGWVRHPFEAESTAQVVERLVLEQAVVPIPGTVFTPEDDRYLRLSFANLSADEIQALGLRLEGMA